MSNFSTFIRLQRGAGAVLLAAVLTGCNQPNYNAIANRLRETNMAQEKQIAALKEEVVNRDATIQLLRERTVGPPVQTLSADRLAELFTVDRMEIQGETRVDTWEENGKNIQGFRVFVRMMTKDGQYLPAAGTLTIEAFELPPSPAEPRRIGAWTFTPAQMKKVWYSGFGLDHFAFNCGFTQPPTIREITFKARFVDALAGGVLEAHLEKWLDPTP